VFVRPVSNPACRQAALPIEWKELKNLQSADQFTMKDVLKRAKSKRAKSLVPRQTLSTS
jgi:DNA primase